MCVIGFETNILHFLLRVSAWIRWPARLSLTAYITIDTDAKTFVTSTHYAVPNVIYEFCVWSSQNLWLTFRNKQKTKSQPARITMKSLHLMWFFCVSCWYKCLQIMNEAVSRWKFYKFLQNVQWKWKISKHFLWYLPERQIILHNLCMLSVRMESFSTGA